MKEKNSYRKKYIKIIIFSFSFILPFSLSIYFTHINFSQKQITKDNVDSSVLLEPNSNSNSIDSNELDQTAEPISPNDPKTSDSTDLANNIGLKKDRTFNPETLINDNRGIPVLYYHSVKPSEDNEVTISPDKLYEQLKYLLDNGYTPLTLNELKEYLINNSSIPNKSIVITFDDGYMDNYYYAFPILKDLGIAATIFCITNELNGEYYLSKEAIIEMSDYGIDIQSHTVTHPHLNTLTYEQQLVELKNSKEYLESILGKKVDSIAYPFGYYNDTTIKAAADSGYTLGFTTKRGLSDRNDAFLKLDRIYVSSAYDLNTFKTILNETAK